MEIQQTKGIDFSEGSVREKWHWLRGLSRRGQSLKSGIGYVVYGSFGRNGPGLSFGLLSP